MVRKVAVAESDPMFYLAGHSSRAVKALCTGCVCVKCLEGSDLLTGKDGKSAIGSLVLCRLVDAASTFGPFLSRAASPFVLTSTLGPEGTRSRLCACYWL